MFEEPSEDPKERPMSPGDKAKDKFDEFRTHAERAAVFEGNRKFDAEFYPDLDGDIARDIQKTMGRLEKARHPDTPVVLEASQPDAARILDLPTTGDLPTNNYHIHRRPGEVMIVRWLAGDEVETFYERLQAHFEAALTQFREEEKQQLGWKKDEATAEYLEKLDAFDVKMSDLYLRPMIKEHGVHVLSMQSADEMDILYLTEYLMNSSAAEIVGETSAPPEEPTEQDLAWFFKLFALRGIKEGVEQMCFFAFLQKSDGDEW